MNIRDLNVNGRSNCLESYPGVVKQPEVCEGPTKDSRRPAKESGQSLGNQVAGFPWIGRKKEKNRKDELFRELKHKN